MNKNEKNARLLPKGASLGGWAFHYLTHRARWYLTGISTLQELLTLLRTVPTHGWRLKPRERGTSGSRNRTPRTGD